MQSGQLEAMVYGEDIAALEPAINHRGVAIREVHRTGNPGNPVLELELADDVSAGFANGDPGIDEVAGLRDR